jgi:hypothetical protein
MREIVVQLYSEEIYDANHPRFIQQLILQCDTLNSRQKYMYSALSFKSHGVIYGWSNYGGNMITSCESEI